MFETFRTKYLDATLAEARSAKPLAFAQYEPVYAAIERYVVGHGLIVSDEKQDVMRTFKIYGPSIFFHANALANTLAELMPWIRLNTDVREREFTIQVDSAPMVRMFNIHPEFAKIIASADAACLKPADRLSFVPPEVELVDIYRRLYSPANAKSWDMLRKYEAAQWERFAATRAGILECGVVGGRANEHEAVVLAWAAAHPEAVIVGNYALTCMSDVVCTMAGAIQLIVGDTKNAIASLRRHIRDITGLETSLKIHELNLPTDHRIRKYVLSAKVGGQMYYIANIFNSPEYELVPWVQIGEYKVGTLCVILRFLMIDLWFLRILRHFNLLDAGMFKRNVGILFENADTIHSRWAYEEIMSPPSYVGVYEDEAISKKADQPAFPYYPAQYKREHGAYRKIGSLKGA